ncbi:MAG: hypothetical protein EON95_07985 [Caulobacteraceae bacterium]|nr:MAG: hypothetical protein EON95_07985 [Caulobacteraceae bacterium]
MIVERTLAALATAAAVVAAVSVAVVSAFFALFALVEPYVGAAGAGAVVAGAAALLAAIIAMIAARKMHGDRTRHQAAEAASAGPGGSHTDVAHILLGVIKDRPLLSAGAALAVGVYALRNPALISAVVRGFMDGKSKF